MIPNSQSIVRVRSINYSKQEGNKQDSPRSLSPSKRPIIIPYTQNNQGKKVLVLDLDETLIHTFFSAPETFDLHFKVQDLECYVKYRPGVIPFLNRMKEKYEIFVWTASISEYANIILDQLDPEKKLISYRLFRESCDFLDGTFVKDLSRLSRNIKDIVIVDNLKTCFRFHQENGIQISDFTTDLSDSQLFKLEPFLNFLSEVYDVRDVRNFNAKFRIAKPFLYKNMKEKEIVFIVERFDVGYEQNNEQTVLKTPKHKRPIEIISHPYQFERFQKDNDAQKSNYFLSRDVRSHSTQKQNDISRASRTQDLNNSVAEFQGIRLLNNSFNTCKAQNTLNNSITFEKKSINQLSHSQNHYNTFKNQNMMLNKAITSPLNCTDTRNSSLSSSKIKEDASQIPTPKFTEFNQNKDSLNMTQNSRVSKVLTIPKNLTPQPTRSGSGRAQIISLHQSNHPYMIDKEYNLSSQKGKQNLNELSTPKNKSFQPTPYLQQAVQIMSSENSNKKQKVLNIQQPSLIPQEDIFLSPIIGTQIKPEIAYQSQKAQGDSNKFKVYIDKINSPSTRQNISILKSRDSYYFVPINNIPVLTSQTQPDLNTSLQNQSGTSFPQNNCAINSLR